MTDAFGRMLANMIRSLIKRSVSTLDSDTTEDVTRTQVSYMGKTKKIEVYLPYGIAANIPKNMPFIQLNIQGQEENTIGLPYNIAGKEKNLVAGEMVIYNPVTGAKVKFKADGTIIIEAQNEAATKGVARLDDATIANATTDATFETWRVAFNIWAAGLGMPSPMPATRTGKINSASTKVKASD